MSILTNILRGTARPAVMRPVPMVPAARSQAVQTLELRIRAALPTQPPLMEVSPDGAVRQIDLGPQTRRYIDQLERELVMERLRVKELRQQLAELTEGRPV